MYFYSGRLYVLRFVHKIFQTLMAELFVLRAVCFGRAYGTLKWQKTNKQRLGGVFIAT